MVFVPVPQGIMAELRFRLDGQRLENVLWFDAGEAVVPATLVTVGAMLKNWWDTGQQGNTTSQMTLEEVYVSDQSSSTGPTYTYVTGLPLAGTDTPPSAPNALALCVSFRTATRGRSGRGRNYVAGMPQSQLVSNDWSTTYINSCVGYYNNLIGLAADNGVTWCVCSRFHEGAPRALGQLLPIVAALAVDATVDTQRRRSPGRGQ